VTDRTAPTTTIRFSSRRGYRALLDSGVSVRVRCSETCRLTGVLDLSITVSSGKTKRTKTYVLGRSSAGSTIPASTYVTVRIKLSKAGRARLRTWHGSRLRLTITATDGPGNARTSKRSIQVVR
jgi:hypothetical protein